MTLHPYLNFPGNTEEAFNFYKSVFGGEFAGVYRFKDMPGENVPPQYADKLMHIALPVGKDVMLMGTDALEEMGHKVTPGTNFHINIMVDTKEEADKLFHAIGAGGKVAVPIAEQSWGDYFGQVTDKFGISWMVNCILQQYK